MKINWILSFMFFVASCNNSVTECSENTNSQKSVLDSTINRTTEEKVLVSIYDSSVLAIDNVLINNQKILLTKAEFNKAYPQIDSTLTDLWECGSPFEWLDEKWMIKTYGKIDHDLGAFKDFDGRISTIYSHNVEYNSNKHLYLFNTAYSVNNSVKIISKNIALTPETTTTEFERLFPNAEKEKLENPKEVRYRFYVEDEFDNSFLFYFKNNKFEYLTLWWLLC